MLIELVMASIWGYIQLTLRVVVQETEVTSGGWFWYEETAGR